MVYETASTGAKQLGQLNGFHMKPSWTGNMTRERPVGRFSGPTELDEQHFDPALNHYKPKLQPSKPTNNTWSHKKNQKIESNRNLPV